LAKEILRPLAYVINLSFTSAIVPNQLKLAKVIPILKIKKWYTDINNYMLVSLLSKISKIFEKAFYN
jgi:hypothetical protein